MTDGAGGRSRRPSPVAPDGPTIWEVRIVSTDRSTAAQDHDLTRADVTEREMELVAQREDLRQALADALAWIASLRTLIEQAAAEAIHGELTDGTLASMVEVAESD